MNKANAFYGTLNFIIKFTKSGTLSIPQPH